MQIDHRMSTRWTKAAPRSDGRGVAPVDISLIIPTLNEAENIDPLLTAIFGSLADQSFAIEVLVVDDGSTDSTRDRVRAWSENYPVRLIERDNERGLTGAVLAGAQVAAGDVVVVMDADLSHPADALPKLIEPVLSGQCDMVIGSRYTRGGATVGWPMKRKVISRVASLLAWPLVDVADPMSGYFSVRKEHVLKVDPKAGGFKIGLEVIANASVPLTIEEVPIVFTERQAGHSKLGAGQVMAYLDRLRVLAGGRVSSKTAARFGVVGLMGVAVDSICFALLMMVGVPLALSHLISFAAASVFNFTLNVRWSFRDPSGDAIPLGLKRCLRYTAVLLMALAVRGAALGFLYESLGWPPFLAVVVAIGIAAAISYLGYAFYVFPSDETTADDRVRWRIACVGIVGFLILVRFFNLGLTELLMEEAYYWNYAKHPSLGYLDHPPMVAWLIGLGTFIFGNTEFGVRIPALMCWAATAWFGYAATREMFGKSAAMRTVLLLSALPFFFSVGFLMTPDAPLTACWAGTLYFLQRVLLGGHARSWFGVGLCIGLGMLSKYSIALLGPAIVAYILIDPRSRHWFFNYRPYLAILIAVLVFLPVIIWNANHEWASFAFQSVDRIQSKPSFGLHLLIGSMFLLLTPVGLIAAIRALAQRRRDASNDSEAERIRIHRRRLFALIFTLLPLSVFFLFSLQHQPKLNWTGPVWLASIPLLAANMIWDDLGALSLSQRKRERIWARTVTIAALGYGLFLYYTSVGLPGVAYPDQFIFAGYRSLGEQIEAIEDQVEAERGESPLVAGLDKYGISSRLAFYRFRDEPVVVHEDDMEGVLGTTGRHFVGGNSLMYAYWMPIDGHIGRDIIMVDSGKNRMMDAQVARYFDSLSPIRALDVSTRGHAAGQYYYRIGYSYRTDVLSE